MSLTFDESIAKLLRRTRNSIFPAFTYAPFVLVCDRCQEVGGGFRISKGESLSALLSGWTGYSIFLSKTPVFQFLEADLSNPPILSHYEIGTVLLL